MARDMLDQPCPLSAEITHCRGHEKEAIEQEEIRTRFEAVDLEHERKQHRSLDWVESKAREVISLAHHEMIDAADALQLIAAIVGYEDDEKTRSSHTNP